MRVTAHSVRSFVPMLLAFAVVLSDARLSAQQRVEISGTVTSAMTGLPVSGALVAIGTAHRATTANGRFQFTATDSGMARLSVRMIGYEPVDLEFFARSDTTLEIRLRESALRLDRIDVEARTTSIRGRVTDHATRLGVEADVTVQPGGRDNTDFTGRYKVSNVPALDSTRVTVEAFSYLAQSKWINSARVGSVDFVMRPDSVVYRIIDRFSERLMERTRAAGHTVEGLTESQFHHTGSVLTMLRYATGLRCIGSIVFDDDPERRFHVTPLPSEVQFIEIIGRRGSSARMVRIYTKEYYALKLGSNTPLNAIELEPGPMRRGCR
jgi:hypothetical protein